MILDTRTNNPKGMAFVKISSVQEATKAIEGLNGAEIDGRTIKANFSIPTKGPIKKFYLTPTNEKAKKPVKDFKEKFTKKNNSRSK